MKKQIVYKQLSDYNLDLKKWRVPYYKQYVRGEITYKEYQPGISETSRTLRNLVPLFYNLAIASTIMGLMNKSLRKKKII